MKICAACHEDLPKESYSKKQWKLDIFQRRCKVCITNNQEVQSTSQHNTNANTNEITKALDFMRLVDTTETKISDEELFKRPPPAEDCPICFLPTSFLHTGSKYQPCCGKRICSGCIYAVKKRDCDIKCPFCRTPYATSDEELLEKTKIRMEAGDADAFYNLGHCYQSGTRELPQNYTKALELYHRAGELGNAQAYSNIGFMYQYSKGVDQDEKKAIHYYKLAAIRGETVARSNLGIVSAQSGNMDRAVKHFTMAAGCGCSKSLEKIKYLYTDGHASKDDYKDALLAYQSYLGSVKSPQRDEAAAVNECYNCY